MSDMQPNTNSGTASLFAVAGGEAYFIVPAEAIEQGSYLGKRFRFHVGEEKKKNNKRSILVIRIVFVFFSILVHVDG